ncbi:hypothetical protein [Streptomyces sp. NPDC046870]|uniref:hypothetical protein n=1 Tax=Streptomyces sp. NPDC046870 TaxID=3155135 RepID=UPI003452EB10
MASASGRLDRRRVPLAPAALITLSDALSQRHAHLGPGAVTAVLLGYGDAGLTLLVTASRTSLAAGSPAGGLLTDRQAAPRAAAPAEQAEAYGSGREGM